MSVLVCRIEEVDNKDNTDTQNKTNKTSKQVILSIKNEKETLTSCQCNIQDLCEQLPTIMQQLMQSVKDKTGIDEIVLDFDVHKNITTKRVLMSFLLGFFDNKIEVIDH